MKIQFKDKILWRAFQTETSSSHFSMGFIKDGIAYFFEDHQRKGLPEGINGDNLLREVEKQFKNQNHV